MKRAHLTISPHPHPKQPTQVAIPGKVCLPQRKYNTRSAGGASTGPITLVLDLDETLVHCTVEPVPDPDMVFPVEFNGVQYQVHVRKRPHLEEFLLRVSKMFEVVVFTASQQVGAGAGVGLVGVNAMVDWRACMHNPQHPTRYD